MRWRTWLGAGVYAVVSVIPVSAFADRPITALAPVELVADGFSKVVGVAVAPDGTAYLTHSARGRVYAITPTGQARVIVSGLKQPAGLALDPEGRLLIVEEGRGRVLRYDSNGTFTTVADQLRRPKWVAVAADGTLYITAHRLLGPDGSDPDEANVIVRRDPSTGTLSVVATDIQKLEGLALNGNVLYATASRLESLPPSGGVVVRYPIHLDGSLGAPSALVAAGLKQPEGLVLDRLGALYITAEELRVGRNRFKRAIGKLHPDAHPSAFAEQLTDPQGVALGPDGSLYVADGTAGRLLRFRAPPAPALDALAAFTHQSSVRVAGTAEPGSRVDVFVNEAETAATGTSSATGAFSVSIALVLNAVNAFEVFATTHAGDGLTGVPAEATLTHDGVPPEVVFLEPPPSAFVRQTATVRAQAADEGSGVATLGLSEAGQALPAGLTPLLPASSVTATAPWDTTAVADGSHTLVAAATDRAGNIATASRIVLVDNTPPDTQLIDGPSGELAATEATFVFTGTDNLTPPVSLQFAWRLDGGPSTAFSAAANVILSGLAEGPHTFEVTARDLAGNEDSTPAQRAFTVRGLRVTITEPTDGATVPEGLLLVRGTIEASGVEVGVTVNGVPAASYGATFAALVSVTPDTTSVTALATLANGTTAAHAIGLTVTPTPTSPGALDASPRSGVAPLTVVFSLRGGPVPMRVELDADGDGRIDFTGPSLAGQSFTYTQPGVYIPTLTVTDAQGGRSTPRTVVQVSDHANLDALFQAKWAAFRDALGRGDIEAAVALIANGEKEKFRNVFQRLALDLPAVAASLRGITAHSLAGGIAEYATTQERDGRTFIHFIYFMPDADALWKIVAM